jgi:DNA repair protein SbcC/Rad50
MCYREEQTLDFSGIHLACLAGDNGHGKSALLDAMTWALWGKARARRDDELITLGETEMWVEFEFDLAGQRYRIVRQRSKRGQGQSDLHLHVWNAAGGEWQLLDEGNLRDRQVQITRLLRMEYETFTNSAFLLQGRADSFTVKTPSERKQILGDILGLSRYDAYEERAKHEVQTRKEGAVRLLGEIDAIDRELARRDDYETRLRAARDTADQAVRALRSAEGEQSRCRSVLEERQGQARQLAGLQDRLTRARPALEETRRQLDSARSRLNGFEAVLAQREEIEAGWGALQAAREEEAAWNAGLLRSTQLQEHLTRARLAVDKARLGLEAAHGRLVDRRAELARKVALGHEQAVILLEVHAALARLAGHQARRDTIASELREVGDLIASWKAEEHRFSEREADLQRKMAIGREQSELLDEVREILACMSEQQDRRDAIASDLRAVGEQAAGVRADMERARTEGQSVNYKRTLLDTGKTAACPLCGQPLTADHQARMIADLSVEHDALTERYRMLQAELKKILDRSSALEAEDAALERGLRTRDARQHQAAQAEAAVAAGEAAVAEYEVLADRNHVAQAELRGLSDRRQSLEAEDVGLVDELRVRDARQRQLAQAEAAVAEGGTAEEEGRRLGEQIAELDGRLTGGDYAPAERAEMALIQAAIADIGYDVDAHERVRARLAELDPFDARYHRQLMPALDGIDDARARVDALVLEVARREAELTGDEAERDRLTAAVADLPELQTARDRAAAAVDAAATVERRARQEEGAAMQQLDALAAQAETRTRRTADLAALNEEIGIYNQLREAFGKKGVQAMIIESAIPEVEVEANRLLNRMSDGRMSLRLETQREKVTGGVAETLDIVISDELGGRPYEMYSGGEAFRANLALRIAISKLLARRAGAQLQTLVIDEGFGTQDAQGRQLLVEAINSIQDDFERILVVTHIEELKDLFPARIDVVKTAGGSRVSVV